MKELTRTRRLIIASSVFVIIIVIGLLTFRKPDFEYRLTVNDLLKEMTGPEHSVSLGEAYTLLNSGSDEYVFIDLRNPYEFDKGSLPGAINIPVSDMLDEQNIDFLNQMEKENRSPVFYAASQREANGTWMIMKQLGFNRVKTLAGGYTQMEKLLSGTIQLSDIQGYSSENPRLDYRQFMEKLGMGTTTVNEEAPRSVQSVMRKKKSAAEGGC